MNERLIQLRGAANQRSELVHTIAGNRTELVKWVDSLGSDFPRLRDKAGSSSISVGVSLMDEKLYENLTVGENLNLLECLCRECPVSAESLMAVFALTDKATQFYGKLPEAVRLRAQLAASLLSGPEIVVWEEPDFSDSEFLARLFDWLEENEIDVIFSASEPLDGVACRIINIKGEQ